MAIVDASSHTMDIVDVPSSVVSATGKSMVEAEKHKDSPVVDEELTLIIEKWAESNDGSAGIEVREVGFGNFTMNDGTRFNYYQTKPQHLRIQCDREDGDLGIADIFWD